MLIRWLTLRGFMSWDTFDQELPQGLTLLVGDNGTGKSAIIEGVAWTLFGDTIRRSKPDSAPECRGEVVFEQAGQRYTVERWRSRGKVDLRLSRGSQNISGATPTDTQEAIDRIVGSYARFKATVVFAREFMVRFAAATDKEQKLLMDEMIPGMERFEPALRVAREDIRKLERQSQEISVVQARNSGQLSEARRQAQALAARQPRAAAAIAAELEKIQRTIADDEAGLLADQQAIVRWERDSGGRQAELRHTNEALHSATARLQAAQDKRRRATGKGKCPTCFQDVDPRLLAKHFEEEERPLKAEVDKHTAALQRLGAIPQRPAQQVNPARLPLLRREADKLSREQAEAAALEEERDRVAAAISDLEAEAAKGAEDLANNQRQRDLHEAAADVLGVRGARVLLFGRALRRVEAKANDVLQRLGAPVRVKLSDKKPQANGKVVDALYIQLAGAGGGSYEGLSSGERTRVDVALLLGLAALGTPGALFFDEVFDTLDPEGIERIAAYLSEIGHDRQILLLSHPADLTSFFPSSSVWKVAKASAGSELRR